MGGEYHVYPDTSLWLVLSSICSRFAYQESRWLQILPFDDNRNRLGALKNTVNAQNPAPRLNIK